MSKRQILELLKDAGSKLLEVSELLEDRDGVEYNVTLYLLKGDSFDGRVYMSFGAGFTIENALTRAYERVSPMRLKTLIELL